jgi:hypothetical protein
VKHHYVQCFLLSWLTLSYVSVLKLDGKFLQVLVGDKYESCCVVVHNMQRCVFAVPAPSVFPSDVLSELEQAANAGGPVETSALNAKLQVQSL